MTLAAEQIVYSYSADGVQTEWPVEFEVLADKNVTAYIDGSLLVQGTDYNVVSLSSGDRVVRRIGEPWTADQTLTLIPSTAIEQVTDLVQYGRFDAETIERVFDRMTHISRELAEKSTRALTQSLFESVIDARGNRIINVADPINANDVVNRAFLLAYFATLPAGPEGPAGPSIPGASGLPGPAGTSLPQLSGSGAPVVADGVEGQTYLNVDSGDLYQKVNGAWIFLVNLQGPQGAPGTGSGGGVTDHGALTGLNDPDHPQSAIAGLEPRLNTIEAAQLLLANADIDVYRQATAPAGDIVTGSLWFDTDDGNRLYRWDGAQWVDQSDARLDSLAAGLAQALSDAATAQATADGGIEIFYADVDTPTPPTGQNVGDYWVFTDGGGSARWDGSAWIPLPPDSNIALALQNAANAQATADGRIYAYFQGTAPNASSSPVPALGDLWFNTTDGNHPYRYNGTTWVSVRDASIAAAAAAAAQALQQIVDITAQLDGVVEVYYQDSEPDSGSSPPPTEGDLWINSTTNELWRFVSGSFTSVRDNGLAQAITDSATAIGLADQKVRFFIQDAEPIPGPSVLIDTGDIWIETDNNNRTSRWNGSAWEDVSIVVGTNDILPSAVSVQIAAFSSEDTGAQLIAAPHVSTGNLITLIGTVNVSVFGAANFGLDANVRVLIKRRPVGGAFTTLRDITLPSTTNTDGNRDGQIYASVLDTVRGSANWIVKPLSASTLHYDLEFRFYDTPGSGQFEYALEYVSFTSTGAKTFTTALNTTEIKR